MTGIVKKVFNLTDREVHILDELHKRLRSKNMTESVGKMIRICKVVSDCVDADKALYRRVENSSKFEPVIISELIE